MRERVGMTSPCFQAEEMVKVEASSPKDMAATVLDPATGIMETGRGIGTFITRGMVEALPRYTGELMTPSYQNVVTHARILVRGLEPWKGFLVEMDRSYVHERIEDSGQGFSDGNGDGRTPGWCGQKDGRGFSPGESGDLRGNGDGTMWLAETNPINPAIVQILTQHGNMVFNLIPFWKLKKNTLWIQPALSQQEIRLTEGLSR
jgi:hypothetical protein